MSYKANHYSSTYLGVLSSWYIGQILVRAHFFSFFHGIAGFALHKMRIRNASNFRVVRSSYLRSFDKLCVPAH